MIVAINKMDKAEADPTRVKNELLQHEIIAEDMGGDTQMIEVSAQTGAGRWKTCSERAQLLCIRGHGTQGQCRA